MARTTIDDWLATATRQLSDHGITSARLDALVILSAVYKLDKAQLLAKLDEPLQHSKELDSLLAGRLKRLPLAYLVGVKEFFGHPFSVNNDVLIPRPESETIVEWVVANAKPLGSCLDVGTGCGALAVSIKLSRPDLKVTATDNSPIALALSRQNAKRLRADVFFTQSDLLASVTGRFDLIVANLPYLDPKKQYAPEIYFEPFNALFSEENGLAHYRRLAGQVSGSLHPEGSLLIEHNPDQFIHLKRLFRQPQLSARRLSDFITLFSSI